MNEIHRQIPYKDSQLPNPRAYWERSTPGYLQHIEGLTGGDGRMIRDDVLTPRILEHLGDISGKLILDSGCGDGILSRVMSKEGARVVGGDVIYRIAKAAHTGVPAVPVSVIDVTQPLPFPDSTFDAVLSNLSYMWLPDIEIPSMESYRVLKPGGKLVVSITHPMVNLGEFDLSNPDAPKLILQASLQNGIWLKMINGTNGPYPYYQRPPSVYVNTFTNAGFHFSPQRGYDDVFFSDEFLHKHPGYMRHEWYPLFLLFDLYK